MAFKPSIKRGIFWSLICLVAAAALAVIIVPPMITLNNLKPKLESVISEQTNIHAKIAGDINFSLLGHATIVAHNITVPNGTVGTAMFRIPLRYIFDLGVAPLNGVITIYDAKITASSLAALPLRNTIKIYDSTVVFMDKDYGIIDGTLSRGKFNGRVRTDQHKYDIEYTGDKFSVVNRTNDLIITGRMTTTGGATGTMSFHTKNINRLFEFTTPPITQPVAAKMQFEWDGEYGFKFSKIVGENFNGNITLHPDGMRDIQISATDLDYDLSFLLNSENVFFDTAYDLDLSGNLKFMAKTFHHVKVQARGTENAVIINKIAADDITLSGGQIDATGARDITISLPVDGVRASCLFSGTPDAWRCSKFQYGDISGTIEVTGSKYSVNMQGDIPMPDEKSLQKWLNNLGASGTVSFRFSNAAGTMTINGNKIDTTYKFLHNRTLADMGIALKFIPESMRKETGDFTWNNDNEVTFIPRSRSWDLNIKGDAFRISGRDAHAWFPGLDLRAVNNFEYLITGNFKKDSISNLHISIADHDFTGSASGNSITLKTGLLNLDTFASQDFMDNYEEMEFLATSPLMVPFGINAKVSLSADSIIYNGDEYSNFMYTLKPGIQTFSITDSARGNLLATVKKNKSVYNIFVQLNKFVTKGNLIALELPLNVRDTTVTAEININTFGKIAHDLKYNMTGDVDMTLDGGYITGFGIDEFYASAATLQSLQAEFALSRALSSGTSQLKKMHIQGTYTNQDFTTTAPVTLSMRHTDGTGAIKIANGQMFATFDLSLRGTSPAPKPIAVSVMPDGTRRYSLSEIMMNFDVGFLREFVATHNKF